MTINELSREQELRGLIVRTPWVDYLLDGTKTWEIRGSATSIRGRIALIRGGSRLVVGTADLVDCLALTRDEYNCAEVYHRIPASQTDSISYKHIYAWVIDNPKPLKEPILYRHPQGAVIWVNLAHLQLPVG